MDVAIAIAGSTADRAVVGVVSRRIEEDVVKYLSCRLGCHLSLACDDLKSVLEMGEGVGVHKGVVKTVCAVVVYRALPVIKLARNLVDCVTGASLYAFLTSVAKVGSHNLVGLYLCVGENEAISYHRAEVIGEKRTVEALLANSALNGGVNEVHLILCGPASVNGVVSNLGVGVVLLCHNVLVAALGEGEIARLLNVICHLYLCHRHNGLFHILNRHRGVLIVGSTLLNTSERAAKETENETDHGLCLGHDLEDGIILIKSRRRSKANRVSPVFFSYFNNSAFHRYDLLISCQLP